jgi:phosphate transport system permease protein
VSGKKLKERIIESILFVCAAFSIIAVMSIIGYLLYMGYPTITSFFLHGIITAFNGSTVDSGLAIISDIDGTIYSAAGGTALAVLMGLPCAIYMAEFADMRFRNFTKTSMEVLDGFPSIAIGLIGWGFLASPQTKNTFTYFLGHITSPPGNVSGCIFFAWLILMVMSFPVIATLSEDALRAVPQDLREASLGLGATKWQTTKEILLPYAKSRIVTSILLALAAAMGEMVAIQWVLRATVTSALYYNPVLILNPLINAHTLSIVMENSYVSVQESTANPGSSVYAVGFILFVMIGALNIAIRLFLANRNKQTVE